MAEPVLSAFLTVLFEKLMSRELLNFATQEGVCSKLKNWEKKLKMIDALLMDAEEKQLKNGAVKMWLEELQDLAYDVEDILDEYATEALRRKLKIEEHQASTSRARKLIPACCFGSTPIALWSDFRMHSKIDDVTSRLQELYQQRAELELEVKDNPGRRSTGLSQRTPTTSSQIEPAVYGRNKDKGKILEMVLNDKPGDANVGVISILGMGGLGKTTLARAVYNDEAVKDFNPKGWVCVFEDFDVMRISIAILESITGGGTDLKTLEAVQNKLKEEATGRKFLFVLDDVWSEDYGKWEMLISPLMVGAQGSKIIVTTRLEGVALTMGRSNECHRLNRLSDDDCWSLFSKHASNNGVLGSHLDESIRQKVIEKCKGLPLAARTLGGLLRSKERGAWLGILNSKTWELLEKSEIPTTLKISYYHLPSHLKRCFAYCGIFPKDYEFGKEELVFLWMAEGLIQQSEHKKQLEELGGEYFCDLLSRSIFQISNADSSKFIMHDLVNDLAKMVSKKLVFRLEDELESNNQFRISEKTRYASYIRHKFDGRRKFEVFNDAKHLRTNLAMPSVNYSAEINYISNSVVSNMLSRFRKLRVLSLQKYHVVELPNSIGGLTHLRYLNLAYSPIRSLPNSINSLCNLQTLILRNCDKLLEWPKSMGNLINLRHFDILNASSIQEMPEGVRKWECLQTLSNFIVGKDSKSCLSVLKDLKGLCGELHISRLENVTNLQYIGNGILSDKKDLKVLLLEWDSRFDELQDEEVDKKVLDILQPHEELEKLTIKCYAGTEFPSWVGGSSSIGSKVTVIELVNCNRCTVLPSFGVLGSLKSLTIKSMKRIQNIGVEFYGENCSKPFQSLETLYIKNLEECEWWNPIKERESFPKLLKLSIINCPKLSKRLPNNLSLLKKLVIRECEQLVVSLSNIPKICQLELNNCKKIVCSNSTFSQPLESLTLSNISDFGDWSKQELNKVRNLEVDYCKELIEQWQEEIFLEKPPQELHNQSSLKSLTIKNCNTLTTLLEGIKNKNVDVEELSIKKCDSLHFIFRGELPPSLKKLQIEECEKLQFLLAANEDTCTSLSSTSLLDKERVNANTSHLEDLNVRDCPSLTCLPSVYQLSTSLTSLKIYGCSKLTILSSSGHFPLALKHLQIWNCSNLTTLSPKGLFPETLQTLDICFCPKLESIVEKFYNKEALSSILIGSCDNLISLPEGLETLSRLLGMAILDCKSFASFPEGGFPKNLSSLVISNCSKLEALPRGVHSLFYLDISGCSVLSLSGDILPTKLVKLEIVGVKCASLKAVMEWGLHNLTSLTILHISGGWSDGESFQEDDMKTSLPSSLTTLLISEFPTLKYLPFKDFEDLFSLECLRIKSCKELTSLPSLPPSLLELDIRGCPLLKEACQRDQRREWYKIADIPCVKIDDKFIYDP